jgi:hypothetical protein
MIPLTADATHTPSLHLTTVGADGSVGNMMGMKMSWLPRVIFELLVDSPDNIHFEFKVNLSHLSEINKFTSLIMIVYADSFNVFLLRFTACDSIWMQLFK